MFNSSIIEVTIGLIFVFSLLAILVTQINTIVTTTLNLRAKQLKKGLQRLVTDKELQAKLLSHPLVKMVDAEAPQSRKLSDEEANAIINAKETDVKWLEPRTFVEALMNTLMAESDRTLFQTLQAAVEAMPTSTEKSRLRDLLRSIRHTFSEDTLREIYAVVGGLSDENLRRQLKQGISVIEKTVSTLHVSTSELVPLLNGAKQIKDPYLRAALETILDTAESIEEAQERLESWFNEGMNRASDAFQKQIGRYSLVASFMIAAILNIDTIALGRALWENPELRQDVAAAATTFEQQNELSNFGIDTGDSGTTENGTNGSPTNGDETDPSDDSSLRPSDDQIPDDPTFEDISEQVREAQQTAQTLLDLQLPIGWQYTEVTQQMLESSQTLGQRNPNDSTRNIWNLIPGNQNDWLWLWAQKIVGILITTIAAAQGAPYWFDLLRRLTRGGK